MAFRGIRGAVAGVAFAAALLAPLLAQAATMTFSLATIEGQNCKRGCVQVIVADGVIEEETPQAFLDFVRDAAAEHNARGVVLINSPGGRVVASMRLGALLRKMRAAVIVARVDTERQVPISGQCMSACVYAMMGGVKRVVPDQSRIGIHRMSRQESHGSGRAPSGTERTYASDDMVDALADYAAEMGVSRGVIREAEQISSDDIHIVSPSELRRWRLASPNF